MVISCQWSVISKNAQQIVARPVRQVRGSSADGNRRGVASARASHGLKPRLTLLGKPADKRCEGVSGDQRGGEDRLVRLRSWPFESRIRNLDSGASHAHFAALAPLCILPQALIPARA
jgi:hypothetical protein